MKLNRCFFLLLLPLLWSAVSLLHFQWPGDEYAMWGVSSMAGTWILFLTPNVGDIHQWWIRCSVATAGFFVMGGAGWLLCWLKVRVRIWLVLWLGSSVGWMGFVLMQYPSIERALAKNGSWAAYVFTAILMAAYSATLLTLMGGGIKRLVANPERCRRLLTQRRQGAKTQGKRTRQLAIIATLLGVMAFHGYPLKFQRLPFAPLPLGVFALNSNWVVTIKNSRASASDSSPTSTDAS